MSFREKTVAEKDKDILVEAFRRGRAWNPDPEFQNLLNLDEGRVRLMDGSEPDAKLLVKSLQESDANYQFEVFKAHKRFPLLNALLRAIGDGLIGPATRSLVEIPRCPLPDFPPPPNASFHYDDPELQKVVESMQAAAAFTGSYWRGCDSARPDIHSLTIGIDAKNAPSVFTQNQDKILEARRACAAEIGVAVKFVINPASMTGLQQYQVYRSIPGSVIGMNYFPNANSCGRIPDGSMDSSYNPSDWRLHACLGCHESEGHGFGLNHTNGGTMNPSILLTWPLTWKGDPSWNTVVRYYGGKPIDPPAPPPPPPPPATHPPVTGSLFGEPFGGGFVIRGNQRFDGKWNYVAQPDGAGKYRLVPQAEV